MQKRTQLIVRRMAKLRADVKLDTQQLRFNLIMRLSGLFNIASDIARSRDLDLKVRQDWARVAAYIAQVIEGVSKGFDERQIDKNLDELERMITEARARAAPGETEEATPVGIGDQFPQRPD